MAEANQRASGEGQGTPAVLRNGSGQLSDSNRDKDAGDGEEMESLEEGSSGILDEDYNLSQRRLVRHRYRELINSVHENREVLLSPTNDKLTGFLKQADQVFVEAQSLGAWKAPEAVLDSQFLVLATDLGKEKSVQLRADGSNFDLPTYTEHLLTSMGLNRLEEEDSDKEGTSTPGGYLPRDAWQKLGSEVQHCFRTAPSFHFMLGSFMAEPPLPRQHVERQWKAASKDVKKIMPTQVKKMEEHQEATEKEVERILGYLQQYHQADPDTPISYFEFVIDPKSFSRTIENIFHVSFLIRDGLARIYLDTDKLPYIAPMEQGEAEGGEGSCLQSGVISLSQSSWKEIIQAFDIKDAMISAPISCAPMD